MTEQNKKDGQPDDTNPSDVAENIDNVDISENEEDFSRSPSELYEQYPFIYIENFVGGDVIGGAVGKGARVRTKKFTVGDRNQGGKTSPVGNNSSRPRIAFEDEIELEKWFLSSSTSDDNRIHLVLVAVFAGNTLRFVNNSREYIKRSMAQSRATQPKEPVDEGASLFEFGISQILEETGTYVVPVSYTVESGKTEIRTIDFETEEHQKLVLSFLRSSDEIDKFRSSLTNWLERLTKTSDAVIRSLGAPRTDLTRAQAAIGIGELAKEDYEYYLKEYIRPWALSPNPALRFAVGWSLFALSTEEKHKDNINSLLTYWAKSDNWRFQWSAAATCSRVGLIDLDKTLDIIKILLVSPVEDVLKVTVASLQLLFLSGGAAHIILQSFALWVRTSNDENLSNNVLLVFLSLIQSRFNHDVDDFSFPATNDSDSEETSSSSIVVLLKSCFSHRSARAVDQAYEIVEKWIAKADTQEKYTDIINQRLLVLMQDRTAARYICKIIKQKKFDQSKTARHLRNLTGCYRDQTT